MEDNIMTNYLKAASVLMALSLLSACVSTRVTGQRVGTVEGKVNRIGVYIQPGQFATGQAGALGNKDLSTLLPSLQQRVPLVLQANNIESKVVIGGAVVQNIPLELDGYEYVLRLVPKSISYSSRSGSQLAVSAEVYRRTKGYVWAGTVVMSTLGFGKFESKLADEVAHDLLVLLNRDGVVSVGTVKMPKPAEAEPMNAINRDLSKQLAEKESLAAAQK